MSLEELVLNEPPEGPIVGRWDVKEVAENMREQLDIKDRKHMMRVQPMCFTGVEACAWMLSTGLIETEEQALQLGNSMILNGLISEVNMEHAFRNKPYMYRFAEDEWVRIGGDAGVCAEPMPYRKLMQLAQRMRREMGVGDIEQEGKVYQRCFTGVMCTGWLMHVGLADAEQDAVALGNALVRAGLVHHVARRRPLEASRRLYRFAADALALVQAAKRAALRGVMHPPHRRASRGAGGGGSGASRRSSSASASPSPPGAQIAAMMQLQGDSDEDEEVDLEDILSSIAAAATPGGSLDAAAADPAATPRGSAISSCSGGGDGASSRGGSLCSGAAATAQQRCHGGSGGGRSADSDDISLDAETADALLRHALAPLAANSNGGGGGDADYDDGGGGGGSGGGSAGGSGHAGLAVVKKQARRQSKHVRGGPVWGSCELLPPTALATPMNDDAPPLWPDTACAAAAAAPSATAAAYDDAGICGVEDQFLLALLGIACQFPAPPRHRAWMDAPRKRSTSRGSVNAILSIVNAIDEDFTL